jgi:hypothetical protein
MVPSLSEKRENQRHLSGKGQSESTHVSENNGLSACRERAALCEGEPFTRVTDPDLERLSSGTIVTNEEYICRKLISTKELT